jgi:16S rRNA (adenine1518-N6/adenine1519-N6)-dimethyltransferase
VPGPAFPRANKRLGQHFLIDQNIVRKIVAAAELTPDETVLEVGPGRGILTEALASAARRVVAVEIDPQLHRLLEARQSEWKNVEVVCADALSYSLEAVAAGTVVVGNLPYYISTPLLFKFLEHRHRFPRLVAKAGTSAYGVLSVMAQYAADISKAFTVSANCFRPRPEVGSAVVVVRTKQEALLSPEEEPAFAAVVKAAFAHRRKTLVNSLRDEGFDPQAVMDAISAVGIVSTVRAETLSLDTFSRLATRLDRPKPS